MYKTLVFLIVLIQLMNCYDIVPIPMPYSNYIVSPLWDKKTQSLYMANFVSPEGVNSIFRYDYASGKTSAAYIIGELGPCFIIPVEGDDNSFVVGVNDAVKVINWDRMSPTATVTRTLFTVKGYLNYATTDSKGRLYTGTINSTAICLANDLAAYRYENGQLTTLFKDIHMTNGIAIDQRRGKYYHGDACRGQIVQFDYDCKTGNICNGRVIFDFNNRGFDILPVLLGISVDRDGNILVNLHQAQQFWVIDPRTSTVLKKVEIPSKGISGAVFGGPNLDKLFVTSTKYLLNSTGTLIDNRTNDATFFMINEFGSRGFAAPRIRL